MENIQKLPFIALTIILSFFFCNSYAQQNLENSYKEKLIKINKNLFYRIKKGINYQEVIRIASKAPLFCNNGNPDETNQQMSETREIGERLTKCHWDGESMALPNGRLSSLNVTFFNKKVVNVNVSTPDGAFYAYDFGGKVYVQKD